MDAGVRCTLYQPNISRVGSKVALCAILVEFLGHFISPAMSSERAATFQFFAPEDDPPTRCSVHVRNLGATIPILLSSPQFCVKRKYGLIYENLVLHGSSGSRAMLSQFHPPASCEG